MLDNTFERNVTRLGRALSVGLTVMILASNAAVSDDNRVPPTAAPGAAPSRAPVIGTWVVMESSAGARTGDKAEGTTYRFEDAGKVTVAGATQCAYMIEGAEMKIDCVGALMTGKIEFRDGETMHWTVAGKERMTLKKR